MSHKIHARCFTNLDAFKRTEWPSVFVFPPRIGDYVEGVMGDKRPRLRIISITHNQRIGGGGLVEPFVAVELHHN